MLSFKPKLLQKINDMPAPILTILATAFVGGLGYMYANSRPKRVFISYYSKGDSHNKNLILAWAKSNRVKLKIEDLSVDTKINSENRAYLKRRMKEQIEKADYLIVFIGKDTHLREWVSWEIEQAIQLERKIIAVKEKRSYKSPKPLLGCDATWVYGFSEKKISEALKC